MKTSAQLEVEVEQRKIAEEELLKKNAYLNEAEEIARIGHWEWDFGTKQLLWSDGLYNIFRLRNSSKEITYESFLQQIHPEDRQFVESTLRQSIDRKEFIEMKYRIISMDGSVVSTHSKGKFLFDENKNLLKLRGTTQDVTDQKKYEEEILAKSMELQTLNTELQQFAFVASHDLQEPLRKISTYTSMLEKMVKTNTVVKLDEHVKKIMTSSARMQELIDNILDFSRLTGDTLLCNSIKLDSVIDRAITHLDETIKNTHAIIDARNLPIIEGNFIQLVQLFQNVLSNSLKFIKTNEAPEIIITGEMVKYGSLPVEYLDFLLTKFNKSGNYRPGAGDPYCKITVSDKGIGFDEIYLNKIFTIFQRLHSKFTYPGTGIGLAICKKIAENHCGFITAQSVPGAGADFIIFLPWHQHQPPKINN
ncbi:MAG: ATP-binding protein [Chitinophagaceae bacterium]